MKLRKKLDKDKEYNFICPPSVLGVDKQVIEQSILDMFPPDVVLLAPYLSKWYHRVNSFIRSKLANKKTWFKYLIYKHRCMDYYSFCMDNLDVSSKFILWENGVIDAFLGGYWTAINGNMNIYKIGYKNVSPTRLPVTNNTQTGVEILYKIGGKSSFTLDGGDIISGPTYNAVHSSTYTHDQIPLLITEFNRHIFDKPMNIVDIRKEIYNKNKSLVSVYSNVLGKKKRSKCKISVKIACVDDYYVLGYLVALFGRKNIVIDRGSKLSDSIIPCEMGMSDIYRVNSNIRILCNG